MLAALASVLTADYSLPTINPDPGSYIMLLGGGFIIATMGHLFKVKIMILAGIAMIFSATILIPLYVQFQN
ncbi:MAG: hypothetical protein QOE06_2638 [Thermoleophilaceae bacterium]|jgi:hypothetical protein|nr:hypothetical protein [Thermoleophilaceae bacterium]